MKKRIPNAEDQYPIQIEMGLLDEKTKYLVGWPGYRTYRNKSGLGYVETVAEEAHMEGLMLRWLLTGKFITRNPIYLIFMMSLALLIGVLPTLGILIELLAGNFEILWLMFVAFPYLALGVLLTINVLLSLFDTDSKSITGD
ncbi:MAG: hypothetical protein HY869_15605 [Chloroflexi bacterium]|nr:hypothetical protein [Chloroflexota bacterium]